MGRRRARAQGARSEGASRERSRARASEPLLTVAEIVAAQARLQPDKIGARDSQRALCFAQWDERAEPARQRAARPRAGKGDRVALLAYNCVEWMEIYVALARAGLVAVPINFRLLGAEIEYIVAHCEARAFIVQDDLRRARRADPRPTSTSRPSGCIHFGGADAPPGWQSLRGADRRARRPTPPASRCSPRTRGR